MKKSNCFQLIHHETGLPFGEHKSRHPLRYYRGNHSSDVYVDDDFANLPVRAILRADGAIGFQRLKPGWDDCDLHFLVREDWTVQWKGESDDEVV